MFIQAGLGIAGGLLILLILVAQAVDGFDDNDTALLVTLALLSLAMATALLVCAIILPRRPPWVRGAILAIELVIVVNGVVNLIYGLLNGEVQPLAILPIIFGMLVIWPLGRFDVKAWFDGKPTMML